LLPAGTFDRGAISRSISALSFALRVAAAAGWRSTIHNGVGKISCTSCFSIMAESISRDCRIVR